MDCKEIVFHFDNYGVKVSCSLYRTGVGSAMTCGVRQQPARKEWELSLVMVVLGLQVLLMFYFDKEDYGKETI